MYENANGRDRVEDFENGSEREDADRVRTSLSPGYRSGEKVIYTIRCFPEIESDKSGDEQQERRSSIPARFKIRTSGNPKGRRHSEVILSPSGIFNRDYFKYSDDAVFGKVDQYVEGIFGKLTNLKSDYRGMDSDNHLKPELPPRNSAEVGSVKHYVNPLEVSENGNEIVTYNSDDYYDDEIGHPNFQSTPKGSTSRDTLFIESESSSRRGSNEAEVRMSAGEESADLQTTVISVKEKPQLTSSPEKDSRNGIRTPYPRRPTATSSTSKIRSRSSGFKTDGSHSDETLNRFSNNIHEGRVVGHGYFDDGLKTMLTYHPHAQVTKWNVGNVNGTGHQERRFSRISVHPILDGPSKDAFGPRLSTVVDEVITNLSNSKEEEKEKKSYEIAYSSGGLLCDGDRKKLPPSSHGPPDNETLLFSDGKRRIDMVLVYEEEDFGVTTETEMLKKERRRVFRENLEKEGLEFEVEDKKSSFDEKTYFLKIHAPWDVMTRYAELMGIKMPIKKMNPLARPGEVFTSTAVPLGAVKRRTEAGYRNRHPGEEKPKADAPADSKLNRILNRIFDYDHTKISEEPSFYKATFSRDREEQFVVKDRETFFTSAQRSQIVWQILMRAKYDSTEKVGIRRLLNDETYAAAFPLHEGSYERDASNGFLFDRRLLYLEWARPSKWYKRQPLWLVRKYFGDKIGLYFAWLGFYTYMLILPSIIGVLCFLYGLCSLDSKDNIPSKEICDEQGMGNITLCPMCDKACRYLKLGDSCMYAKITYLFDNPATVFFAIFMSFWATTYLELWKRQQSIIVWEWDLQFIEEDEEPRPEFETSVKTFRINPVTREKEPYLPTWSKALRFFATGITVLCMIVVVLGAVLGTIIYRISLVAVIYSGGGNYLKEHAKIFTSMTAALINLIIIMILTKFYHQLALWLTNIENPRTQTEYEDSFTFKIFLFEFVNFYSSLIYIAFFKGRFFMYPGDTDARSSEFLKLKGDVCDPAGCLSELCIQLAIIMIGKQCFNNILELLYPKFWNWWYHRMHHNNTKKDFKRKLTRWEEDYQMQDAGRLALFEEYLEMVLQYGFVTLFVAAFPLAPLFALLNNIGEIRLDAYKMVTQSRRPLAERVEDIGAWYGILKGLTYAAVVSNAFVIAYTSDFIPRMVYKFVYSPTHDLRGYIRSSLSEFNTSDYTDEMGSPDDDPDPPICYYRGYRNGPDHPLRPYDLSPQYWHVFAARLAFVVVFEHIVFALTGVMAYVIPDVPSSVKTQMQRERLLAKEAKYEKGLRTTNSDEELLAAIRDQNHSKMEEVLRRGSWGRRFSRNSSSYEHGT